MFSHTRPRENPHSQPKRSALISRVPSQILYIRYMAHTSKSPLIRLALVGTLALTVAIGAVTLAPISESGVPGSDKMHHFVAFFALALPLSCARPRLVLLIILAAMTYGAVIELVQPFVGRDRDFYDFLADAAGAISGGLVGMMLSWLRNRVN